MMDSLRLGPEVDGVAVHSTCAKRKDGDGGSEAEECNLKISCQRPTVYCSLRPVFPSDLVLGKKIPNFPAFDLQSLIRVNEGCHSGFLAKGVVIICTGFGQRRCPDASILVRQA